MLRIVQAAGPAQAKSYFTESLDRGDYYTEGQELAGRWGGKAVSELGLAGEVMQRDFFALCENRNPLDGSQLTQRTKSNRRVGYDINFHAPKDVSVVYALTRDTDILKAFEDSVQSAMKLIESDAQCRVRKGGIQEDRFTANLAWASFVHQTARPVGGVPDPHLHAHCFTFNVTRDPVEHVWKAAQFGNIKKDGEYFEAAFHSHFRRNLEQVGYSTQDDGRYFRLANSPDGLKEKFSRRTSQVQQEAKAKGVIDNKAKGELGARTREPKIKGATMGELRPEWLGRLSEGEMQTIKQLKTRKPERRVAISSVVADKAVAHALEHCFERDAVVSDKLLLKIAMKKAKTGATPEQLIEAAEKLPLIRKEEGARHLITTKEAMEEEERMVDFARDGKGKYPPFSPKLRSDSTDLSNAQLAAANGVLSSRDRVTVVRGGAGTGKTHMLTAIVKEIEAGRKKVFSFAPTTDASHRVLRENGFENAETVQMLLANPRLQNQLKNQVAWVDEAGLMGTRLIGELFKVAEEQGARVILSGDERQHGSVERGGPFKLLRESGVRSVTLEEIRRQSGEYKRIVKKIADGKHYAAYKELRRAGWVSEVEQSVGHQLVAKELLAAEKAGRGDKTLVVAPTHAEKDKLTRTIRKELRQDNLLLSKDTLYESLSSLDLSVAEKKDATKYEEGQVVKFSKKVIGFSAGEKTEVTKIDAIGNVWVKGKAGHVILNNDQAERYDLFQKKELALAEGDRIRITRNGKAVHGNHVLRNGAEYSIKSISDGDLRLDNGWLVSKHYGHVDHAYVQTSFNTQGKTKERILVAQSSESFGASNAEQFYVSVSRGKKSCHIYTDDAEKLGEEIMKAEKHKNAHDIASKQSRERRYEEPTLTRKEDERAREQRER